MIDKQMAHGIAERLVEMGKEMGAQEVLVAVRFGKGDPDRENGDHSNVGCALVGNSSLALLAAVHRNISLTVKRILDERRKEQHTPSGEYQSVNTK
jgi:hypothetical protein